MVAVDLKSIPDDESEQAKMFTDLIMIHFIKDQCKDYNTCYDQIYREALKVKCALIFKETKHG